MIKNTDTTNFITITTGTNALAGWIGGTAGSDEISIPAGGCLLATFPIDMVTLDGTGDADEIKISADTTSCVVELTWVFG